MKSISDLMHNEAVRSVALLLVGFLVGQLQDFTAARRERKKALRMALSDLLEVHYQFAAVETITEEVAKLGPLPEHVRAQMAIAMDSLLPNWDELHRRYDQSVTTLAGIDPLLAFKLRSKDFVRPALQKLHAQMSQNAQGAAVLAPVLREALTSKIEPVLKKAVGTLARKVWLLCWYKTRRTLMATKNTSDEMRETLKSINAIVAPHLSTPSSPHTDPAPSM